MPARRKLSFARTLVTGVSRQLTSEEHWTLYYFEDHASKCAACYNPAAVQQSGRQLCDEGRELAYEVAGLLFRMREDGQLYAVEDEQFVHVEMPAKYEHVSGLFKAVEASRSGTLSRPRSMDAHYHVRPRIPAQYPVGGHRPVAHDHEFDYHDPRTAQYALHTTYAVPRQSSPQISTAYVSRSSSDSQGSSPRSSARWSRGSLFDDDRRQDQMRADREQRIRYNRGTPSFRQSATWG